MNDIQLSNQQLAVIKNYCDFVKENKARAEKEKELKKHVEEMMMEYGVKKFSNDYISMTIVEATESVNVDLVQLEKKEPDLYKELLDDYPKVTKRKAYLRMTVK